MIFNRKKPVPYELTVEAKKDREIMIAQEESFKEHIQALNVMGKSEDAKLLGDLMIDLFSQNQELMGRISAMQYYASQR